MILFEVLRTEELIDFSTKSSAIIPVQLDINDDQAYKTVAATVSVYDLHNLFFFCIFIAFLDSLC